MPSAIVTKVVPMSLASNNERSMVLLRRAGCRPKRDAGSLWPFATDKIRTLERSALLFAREDDATTSAH
jgi:hypothetical protein